MATDKRNIVRVVLVVAVVAIFCAIWYKQRQARSRTVDTIALVDRALHRPDSTPPAERPAVVPTTTPTFVPRPVPVRRPAPPPPTPADRNDGRPPTRLTALEREDLLARNPFKIETAAAPPPATPLPTRPVPLPAPPPPPPRPSNLQLVGTIVGGGCSWAVINDKEGRTESFYAPGDAIGERAKLVEVERSAATVLVDGRTERLTIDWTGEALTAAVPSPAPNPRASLFQPHEPRSGVLAQPLPTADGTVSVSKADLNENFRNLSQLLTQMRVQPYFEQGKPSGFLISSVRRGSFVERLGAQSGDIIKAVNGDEVDSVQKAFKLYNAFKNNNSVQITINRQGKPLTLNFAMQ